MLRHRRFRVALAALTLVGLVVTFIVWRGDREGRLIAEIEGHGGQVHVYQSSAPAVLRLIERIANDSGDDVFLDGHRFDDEWLKQHGYLDCLTISDFVVRYSRLSPESFGVLLREHRFGSFVVPGSSITDEELTLLSEHDSPTSLNVEYTRVSDAGLAAIGPQRLVYVMLGETDVTASGLSGFRGSNKLQGIGLDGLQLTPECVAILATCPKLHLVRLIGPEVDDAALQRLSSLVTLMHIELDRTQVTSEGVGAFKAAVPGAAVTVTADEDRFFDPSRAE